jgi:hypothetical protein
MASRASAAKKQDLGADVEAQSASSSSSQGGTPSPLTPPSSNGRRRQMARLLLGVVALTSFMFLLFITRYDSNTGTWLPIPEVRFSINDIIDHVQGPSRGIGTEQTGAIGKATTDASGGLKGSNAGSAAENKDGDESAATGSVKGTGKANTDAAVKSKPKAGPTDDDVIPLKGSKDGDGVIAGSGGMTVSRFKELMKSATSNAKQEAENALTSVASAGTALAGAFGKGFSSSTSTSSGSSGSSSGSGSGSIDSIRGEAQELLAHIQDTLSWAVQKTQAVGGVKTPNSPISWTRLSVAEVHILLKAQRFLTYITEDSVARKAEFAALVQGGYQCSEGEKLQQEKIMSEISMDICSEIEWYKLAQLTKPDARTAVDVGGNKGYLASLFLSLWGGGGYGISPSFVYSTAQATGMWEGSRNPAGYCRDGFNDGYPLYCPANQRSDLGKCNVRNDGFTVRSFDGSSYLASTINEMLHTKASDPLVKAGKVWQYHHRAVSDTEGTARFTKQSKDAKVQQGPGFEGGKLQKNTASETDTEVVQLITIDTFLSAEASKEGKTYPAASAAGSGDRFHVDIIKVDAEGNDNKVLRGARKAIEQTASLFTFEGGSGVAFSKEDITELDEKWGYSCYSTSRAGLFKWNSG